MVVWWYNKNIWLREIGGIMIKKIFILIAFLFNFVYSYVAPPVQPTTPPSPSGLQCNVCYFPKPLSCPYQCNIAVPCSTPSGNGYECVDFKGVEYGYTQASEASSTYQPTITINFYSTSTCLHSTLEVSQEITSSPPSGCDPGKCYTIDSECGEELLSLASTKNFPTSEFKILIPSEIITISLLVIFVEVSALAIVYAVGKAFSYEKLVTYSKGEMTQALANIILIGIIFSLLIGTNIYSIIQSLQLQLGNITGNITTYSLKILAWNTAFSLIEGFEIKEATVEIPLGPINLVLGVNKIQLIDGIAPFLDVVDKLFEFFSGSYIFILATRIFLNFIVEMFPILLYLGLLLRVIPWSRSAGGYLISFFIVFYFFYPLLLSFFFSLDPFKKIEFTSNTSVLSYFLPYPQVSLLEGFTVDFLNVAIKFILPLILCFIVSLMLVEEFGAILGSFLTRPTLFRLI